MPLISRINRRHFLQKTAISAVTVACFGGRVMVAQAREMLSFGELYGKISVLGLEFSDKVKQLTGKRISIGGFMAPPLKAEADFFVLTEIPMSICPFCSSDADWPDNILVVYLDKKQTFVQPSTRILVTGALESGSWTDPETGFVSLLRLRNARYETA